MVWFKLKVVLFGAKVRLQKQLNLSHTKATVFRQQQLLTILARILQMTPTMPEAIFIQLDAQNQVQNNFVPFMHVLKYKTYRSPNRLNPFSIQKTDDSL